MTPEQTEQLLEYVRQGVDFTKEQAPLIVQETLRWGVADAQMGIALFTLLSLVCLISVICAFRSKQVDRYNDWHPARAIALFLSVVGLTFFVPAIVINIWTLVQIHVAPRVYLLEHLPKLLS